MNAAQYYIRANSCRAQAGEILRQHEAQKHWANLAREDGRNADEKDHQDKAASLLIEFHKLTKEANRLFLISKGELMS